MTPTEHQIDALLATIEHGSAKEAAPALFLSPSTVKGHLHALYTAIGARNRPHAAALLYRELRDRYVLPGDPA